MGGDEGEEETVHWGHLQTDQVMNQGWPRGLHSRGFREDSSQQRLAPKDA